jgi:uncharacterized coiled-coil protein SlyX
MSKEEMIKEIKLTIENMEKEIIKKEEEIKRLLKELADLNGETEDKEEN